MEGLWQPAWTHTTTNQPARIHTIPSLSLCLYTYLGRLVDGRRQLMVPAGHDCPPCVLCDGGEGKIVRRRSATSILTSNWTRSGMCTSYGGRVVSLPLRGCYRRVKPQVMRVPWRCEARGKARARLSLSAKKDVRPRCIFRDDVLLVACCFWVASDLALKGVKPTNPMLSVQPK